MPLLNISSREKAMIAAAVALVAVAVGWIGVYEPAVERRAILLRKIEARKAELAEVTGLAQKYDGLKRRFDALDRRLGAQEAGYSPLASMESLASRAGLKENMVSMAPQPVIPLEGYRETPVELKLEKVTLPRLVGFLLSVRNSPRYLRVKRASIKPRYENPDWLDVSLTISGYEPAE